MLSLTLSAGVIYVEGPQFATVKFLKGQIVMFVGMSSCNYTHSMVKFTIFHLKFWKGDSKMRRAPDQCMKVLEGKSRGSQGN